MAMNRPTRLQLATFGVVCCVFVALRAAGYRIVRVHLPRQSAARIQPVSAKKRTPVEARRAGVPFLISPGDRVGDGTPDFLRLDDAADRESFRGWFALIAEFQALRPSHDVPPEIKDDSALLRFSYRYALRAHDQAWVDETGIDADSGPAAVKKYRYPFTPLGAALFRIKIGPLGPDDLRSGAFAELVDGKTLKEFNTFFVSRHTRDARPGDILFYRQLEQNKQFPSMIYVGESWWLQHAPGDWTTSVIVYHTGQPGLAGKGMRRVTLAELLNHPSPRWRPVAGNPNFLGVYRWNVLRGAD